MTKFIAAPLAFGLALFLSACSETATPNAVQDADVCPYDIVQGPTQGVSERQIAVANDVTAEACEFAIAYFTNVLGMDADTLSGYDIRPLHNSLSPSLMIPRLCD